MPKGVKNYISFCQQTDKSGKRTHTARFMGSLVADFHRNLLKGGVYVYPQTTAAPSGRLRLLYECAPLAWIIEQAGGKASDGKNRILDIVPNDLHPTRAFLYRLFRNGRKSRKLHECISEYITVHTIIQRARGI